MNLNLCLDAVPSFLGFFDLSVAPTLLFYAYIPIFLASTFLGIFVLKRDNYSLLSKYFLGINLSFSVWIFLVLFQWTGAYLETVHLAWQLLVIPEISIFIFSILFSYEFILQRRIPLVYKSIIGFIYVYIAVVLSTRLNIEAFDVVNCEGVVGALWPVVYVFELICIGVVVMIALEKFFTKTESGEKLKTFLFATGMVFFLGIFWASNYFAELTQTYEINLVGPIGMALFLAFLVYIIVRFHTFNIKLLGSQALVVSLYFLILGMLFVDHIESVRIIAAVTLLFIMILGYWLIRGVKQEVRQKEELGVLNLQLKDLIKERENLVHLVTHKVKGSFTRSKYLFAGLLDGMFGEISPVVKKAAEQGLESDNMGIETVDLVLSVANMQKGIVKYEMKKMDLKELVLKTVSEKSVAAEAKGLKIETEIGDDKYNVSGDAFWIKEVINNLIENSIKYTTAGLIKVSLGKQGANVLFSVKDTGIGITEEDKKNLFTEGGRGKDSVKVNVDSTGYGLYSVKLIVEAHKGRVWAESEGEGKGSQFYVELPAA